MPGWMTGASMRFFVLGLTVIAGVFYLTKINSMAATGYEMRDLEKKIGVLESETQKIGVEIAEWSSLASIRGRIADSGMITANGIKYVSWADSMVAFDK